MYIEMVKAVLSQYGTLQGEYDMRTTLPPASQLDEETLVLHQKLAIIEAWLRLLTDEERFVVIKHLGNHLPWPHLLVEYEKQWGRTQVRHVRTLKRFQEKALQKIVVGIIKSNRISEIEKLFQIKPSI